jgi:paraquat-inducible protein B
VYHQLEKIYPEIPTRPTQMEALMNNLSKVDIKGLVEKISALVTHVDTAVGKVQIGELNEQLTNLLNSASQFIGSPDLTNTLATAQSTLVQLRSLAENVNRQVDPLSASVTNTLAQANQTLVQLRSGVDNLRSMVAPDSALQNELTLALNQLANTAESITTLIEYLNQHPNALIAGRKNKEK